VNTPDLRCTLTAPANARSPSNIVPDVNRSQPLLTPAAGASTPWGSASIGGNALATLTANLRHSVDVDIGLGAFVDLDASFSRYFSVEAQAEAHAEGRPTSATGTSRPSISAPLSPGSIRPCPFSPNFQRKLQRQSVLPREHCSRSSRRYWCAWQESNLRPSD